VTENRGKQWLVRSCQCLCLRFWNKHDSNFHLV